MGGLEKQCGRVSVVTAAASLPLLVADAKAHLRIPHDAEDDQIEDAIGAAVAEIDAPHGWLGRSLMPRTLRLTLDAAPPSVVYLPGPPVTSVTKITVRTPDDELEVVYDTVGMIDELDLEVDLTAEPALIRPGDAYHWPVVRCGTDAMRIEYVAGYATADAIPKNVRQWLLMRVGELYRDREASALGVTANRLHHADRMLDNLRVRA